MEVQPDVSSATVTESSANTAAATPTQEASSSTGDQGAVTGTQTPATPETPAYTPNYKFKVMDKELEFDEFVRPSITSKEHEQKLKELYEKAYGIDEVKKLRDNIRDEYKTYKEQANPVLDMVSKATKAYHADDLDTTFEILGIPKNKILQYAVKQIQLEDLSPEQKAAYNQDRQFKREYLTQQEQLQQMQAEVESTKTQQRAWELDQAISKPEVAQFAQAFDQRNGPGAFRNEIIMYGASRFQLTKEDLSPEQIISDIVKKYGMQATQSQVANQTPQQMTAPKEVPVIPVAKGGSSSPAYRQVKSLKDLEQIRKDKFGY